MGDRGNIEVDGVNLYGHWSGAILPQILQESLAKRWRWTDGSYLARIIFCRMVRGEEATETGFGISPAGALPDNEYPVLRVSTSAQRVYMLSEKQARAGAPGSKALASWTFEEFCALNLLDGGAWSALEASANA